MSDSSASGRYVYFFGEGQADGGNDVKHLVGGKGASLAEMTRAQLAVPPGFTISAEVCAGYYERNRCWPDDLDPAIRASLGRLEQVAGRPFGRGDNPLLVAVRSGAAQSMPGMMDTVLNVGLNPDCVRAMAERTGQRRAAWEAYRHFLVMFGHTVAGIDDAVFTSRLTDLLRETGKPSEEELDADEMETLCQRFLSAYREHAGHDMPTEPWAMLCAAINAVFNSWHNERAVTYRQHHHIEGLLGTAVNVQMMCPSEVSGVMFTANPVNPALGQIIIESSYGLGEAIVLGKVTPDRFVLDKQNRHISERVISKKSTVIATLAQDGRGQTGPRDQASLSDPQLDELAQLGLRVEAYFKHPCDIEWGLSQGKFYLLQARAIKTAQDADEREKVRQEEITALKAKAAPQGTVWSRYNLSEILPEPTPMTWAIVKRFMSGRGGFGLMYRDVGLDPDPALDDEGIYDLVCGRTYCNLSREPFMQFRQMPFQHSFAALKVEPRKALYPQGAPNPFYTGWKSVFVLPLMMFKLASYSGRLKQLSTTLPERLRKELLPAFAEETAREAQQDLAAVDTPALLARLERWIQRTLYEFAREGLKPTFLAGVKMANVEAALTQALGAEKVRAAVGQLVMGVRPDEEADLPTAVHDLTTGRIDRAKFLGRFGHRGRQEMELAVPRWAEEPGQLDRVVSHSAPSVAGGSAGPGSKESTAVRQQIAAEVKQVLTQQPALETEVAQLHTFLALRETCKHYLMRGYALIRRILLELDRRHQLKGGIFYLRPDELPRLAKGEDLTGLIAERQRRRKLALSLEVPQVLFSDDLEAIGRPISTTGTDTLQGVPLSAGVAEGPALVLLEAGEAPPIGEPYILVCPSTDPAWVPLFVHARGLVMETGGVLSHGAIVAREFGLPAVAGIPDVYRRLKTGQRLRIDGGSGTVTVLP
jgi:pyruvate,water dikinase